MWEGIGTLLADNPRDNTEVCLFMLISLEDVFMSSAPLELTPVSKLLEGSTKLHMLLFPPQIPQVSSSVDPLKVLVQSIY